MRCQDPRKIRAACPIESNPFVARVRGGQRRPSDTRSSAIVQYLLSVLDTESNHKDPNSVGGYESAEAAEASWEATRRFNDKLKAEGYFVFANGLEDPKTATVVDGQGETPIFTDGPYVETKAVICSRLASRSLTKRTV